VYDKLLKPRQSFRITLYISVFIFSEGKAEDKRFWTGWQLPLVTNTSRLKRLNVCPIWSIKHLVSPARPRMQWHRNCVAMNRPAVNHAAVQTLYKQHTFDSQHVCSDQGATASLTRLDKHNHQVCRKSHAKRFFVTNETWKEE